MRIKKITIHRNRPTSYDQIEVEDTDGNKFFFLDAELDGLVEEQQQGERKRQKQQKRYKGARG